MRSGAASAASGTSTSRGASTRRGGARGARLQAAPSVQMSSAARFRPRAQRAPNSSILERPGGFIRKKWSRREHGRELHAGVPDEGGGGGERDHRSLSCSVASVCRKKDYFCGQNCGNLESGKKFQDRKFQCLMTDARFFVFCAPRLTACSAWWAALMARRVRPPVSVVRRHCRCPPLVHTSALAAASFPGARSATTPRARPTTWKIPCPT